MYIQYETKTTLKQVQKPLNCDFRILEVNDGKGGKAIEENPFLKIWATKISAFGSPNLVIWRTLEKRDERLNSGRDLTRERLQD